MGLTFTLQAILNDNLQVRVIRPLADSSLVFSLSHLLAPPSATTRSSSCLPYNPITL